MKPRPYFGSPGTSNEQPRCVLTPRKALIRPASRTKNTRAAPGSRKGGTPVDGRSTSTSNTRPLRRLDTSAVTTVDVRPVSPLSNTAMTATAPTTAAAANRAQRSRRGRTAEFSRTHCVRHVDRTRDDSTAIGEADEDNVAKVLVQHSVHNILYVRAESYLRTHKMRSFADAGQAGCEHLMPV